MYCMFWTQELGKIGELGGEAARQTRKTQKWGLTRNADRYYLVKKVAARAVMEANTWVWEEFGEAMKKDYQLA